MNDMQSPANLDSVARYALALGFDVLPRTLIVEGTNDVEIFQRAAQMEIRRSGFDPLDGFAIIAPGRKEQGGTSGIIRETLALRGMARTCLLPNGRAKYRFIGLFDNDYAGRQAAALIVKLDTGIVEYKDVFVLKPVMPLPGNLDPGTVEKAFNSANNPYKGLDWEMEDLFPNSFFGAFCQDFPKAVLKADSRHDKIHRELSPDGKARFTKYVKENAVHEDMCNVLHTLTAIRCYFGLR